jgi:chromosome segregation ATPase
VALVAALTAAVQSFRQFWPLRHRHGEAAGEVIDRAELRRRRVDRLTGTLKESVNLLGELETEIALSQQHAEELTEQIEQRKAEAELTEREAAAVRSMVGEIVAEEVGAGGRRSFWQGFWMQVLIGGLYFGAGVWAALLITD